MDTIPEAPQSSHSTRAVVLRHGYADEEVGLSTTLGQWSHETLYPHGLRPVRGGRPVCRYSTTETVLIALRRPLSIVRSSDRIDSVGRHSSLRLPSWTDLGSFDGSGNFQPLI
eukprot:g80559.t1